MCKKLPFLKHKSEIELPKILFTNNFLISRNFFIQIEQKIKICTKNRKHNNLRFEKFYGLQNNEFFKYP